MFSNENQGWPGIFRRSLCAVLVACSALRGVAQTGARYPSFLFLSDIHLNTSASTTISGQDTGEDLWRALMGKLDSLLGSPVHPLFIVYTGDLPAHYYGGSSDYLPPAGRGAHDTNIAATLNGLNRLAAKYKTPVFYAPGNNDGLAGDYYSFADEQQQTPLGLVQESAWFFPAPAAGSVPPCMVSDPDPTLGFYSAYAVAGLRIIALNTVIYNRKYKAVDGTSPDADGARQMSWLAAQLADATARHEKVYLCLHIPPGTDAYSGRSFWSAPKKGKPWAGQFLGLVSRYRGTIAGILYGHTHMDEVRRLYDTVGNSVTAVAISCPGVTPQHFNNPGFKVVYYDQGTKDLEDFTTYYTHPGQASWGGRYYTFHDVYGGTPIFSQLRALGLNTLSARMDSVYTVKNGGAGYDPGRGIEVKMTAE